MYTHMYIALMQYFNDGGPNQAYMQETLWLITYVYHHYERF